MHIKYFKKQLLYLKTFTLQSIRWLISHEYLGKGINAFYAYTDKTLLKRDSNIGVFLWILRNF